MPTKTPGRAAVAEKEWLASDEGKSCASLSGLTHSQYLENRLKRAFRAGWKARGAKPKQQQRKG